MLGAISLWRPQVVVRDGGGGVGQRLPQRRQELQGQEGQEGQEGKEGPSRVSNSIRAVPQCLSTQPGPIC
eukprot:3616779-Alexandrium_andersonii.AAC.1